MKSLAKAGLFCYCNYMKFESLLGKILIVCDRVTHEYGNDELYFKTLEGECFKLHHSQSCCESVSIEEIIGDLADLTGSPILLAEEVVSEGEPEGSDQEYMGSCTWTFYKLSTIRGSVTIRWYGSSNGYYSERVDFDQTETDNYAQIKY